MKSNRSPELDQTYSLPPVERTMSKQFIVNEVIYQFDVIEPIKVSILTESLMFRTQGKRMVCTDDDMFFR